VDYLKLWLQKFIGNPDSSDHAIYHDGTDQAKETAERIGFSFRNEEGERAFLGCNAQLVPDEYDLGKALRLLSQTPEKNVILITDWVYLSQFARFYLARIQKDNPMPNIAPGGAMIVTDDGTLHHVSPQD